MVKIPIELIVYYSFKNLGNSWDNGDQPLLYFDISDNCLLGLTRVQFIA